MATKVAQENSKKEKEYMLDNEEEMGRLSNQHAIFKDAMSGLLLVPVDLSAAPLRILDSATADGESMERSYALTVIWFSACLHPRY